MAIVKNFWLKNQTKKLAGAVIYQAMGQTRSRELAAEVSNPRTVDQMSQRVKWSNLVNFYRANKSWMKFAFESKPSNRTDYNQFMSLNVANSRIYLPKGIAGQGGCIVDNYVMTQGSLASIEVNHSNGGWDTNLYLPQGFDLSPTVTVGEVAQALLSSNPALREGDQISFIRMTQQTNSNTGVPYVVVRKYEVILNSSDVRFFYQFMPEDYISNSVAGGINYIYVEDSGNAGGFLLILSRTVGGRTYVSSQSVVVANNEALIQAYSSSNALQTAIDSYGESSEPFLTSTTADINTQSPTGVSVLYVTALEQRGVPGQIFGPVRFGQGTVDVQLSGRIENGVVANGRVAYYHEGTRHEEALALDDFDGETISFDTTHTGGDLANAYIQDIQFEIDGTPYRAVFVVPNEATQGGLD